MIPPVLIAQIQVAEALLLTDTCTIEVQQPATDEYGAPAKAWAVVASGVACRVITIGNRFREVAEQVGGRESMMDSYRLIVPAGTALAINQRVTTASDGLMYDVVDLVTARTDETDRQAVMVRAR